MEGLKKITKLLRIFCIPVGIRTRYFLNLSVFFVRFEIFMAVAMKNGVFWDVTPCGSSQRASVASYS
jgi:hypothetical protein